MSSAETNYTGTFKVRGFSECLRKWRGGIWIMQLKKTETMSNSRETISEHLFQMKSAVTYDHHHKAAWVSAGLLLKTILLGGKKWWGHPHCHTV